MFCFLFRFPFLFLFYLKKKRVSFSKIIKQTNGEKSSRIILTWWNNGRTLFDARFFFIFFLLLSSSSCLVFIKIGTLSIYIFYSCQIHTRPPCSRFLRTLAHQIAMRHTPSARHLRCCRCPLCCQKLWLIITLNSKSVLNRKTTHTQSLSHFCQNTHAARGREKERVMWRVWRDNWTGGCYV